jgi:glycosyltransferase involved in cell wall biosynthesis
VSSQSSSGNSDPASPGHGVVGAAGQPLVSVVIPAFNAHRFIARALDSVLRQTYPQLEILIINDGSSDTELLERALQPYQARIRYFEQENRGPSAARNRAIGEARGLYVAFLDSDDAWLPHHLARQVALLQRDSAVHLVYSDSILMRGDRAVGNAFTGEPQHPPVTFEKILTEECTVMTSSTVATREAMIAAGLFDERYRRCEDFDLWLRMAFRGSRMDYSPEPGIYHYLTEQSLASDTYLLKRARIEVYQKTAATLPLSPAQRALVQSLANMTEANCQKDLLKNYLRSGEYDKALEAASRAIDLGPPDWRLLAATFALRRMPAVFRQYHRLHERLLEARAQFRAAHARKNLKVPSGNAGN